MRTRIEAYIVRDEPPKQTRRQIVWDWVWRVSFALLLLGGLLAGLAREYDRGGYLIALAILLYVSDEKGRLS